MLCAICNVLNAADLLKRVEADLQLNAQYPAESGLFVFSYYDHHGSFDALEASAAAGCGLCQLIAREYKETKIHWAYFKGQTRVSVIREGEQLGRRISLGVRLDSEHLNISSSGIEARSMFDLLVVNAILEPEEDDEEVDIDDQFATFPGQFLDFEPVIFILEKLRGWSVMPPSHFNNCEDSTSIGPHTIGRYRLDPELGSKLNYDIASSWLHKCCNAHSKCPDSGNVPLPSRLVAVGTETKGPRLVLTEGQTGRYTALSHCWGGDVPLKTTTKTIETFKESINLENLPLNFRDSIYITREIGLEYIWIDSLCIIQDSKSDWETQSENMGEIYARSLFTLSATASPNVSHGILKTAVEYRPFKEQVFLKLYSRPSAGSVAIKCRNGEAETTNTLLNHAALSKRGWCLQENILPSRVLHYGKQQLYWQCQHGFQSADGIPEGKTTWNVSTYYEIQSYIHKSHSSDEKAKSNFLSVKKCRENYLALISTYSDRQLSDDNDKFPAFGGLAAKFGEVFEGKYIAGIWTSFWRECLLWYKDISTAKHCVPYRAPSWSWAVTNENILWAATSEAPMASSAYDATLLPNHEVKLKNEGSENIYGQVAFAKIEISALTFPFFRSSQVVNEENLGRDKYSIGILYQDEDYTSAETALTGRDNSICFSYGDEDCFLFSVTWAHGEEDPDWQVDLSMLHEDIQYKIALLGFFPERQNAQSFAAPELSAQRVSSGGQCLVLKENPKKGIFERAGYCILDPTSIGIQWEDWIKVWTRQNLILV